MPNLWQLAASLPGLPATKAGPAFGVGTRPIGATRTEVPGIVPAPPVEVGGMPSVSIRQLPGGGTEILWRRQSRQPVNDLAPLQALCNRMAAEMKALSEGPYSLRQLARMGHPYGRGPRGGGRRVPSMRRAKMRLPVGAPNLAVINLQTGHLFESWRGEVQSDNGGVTIRIWNEAPESWFVLHGTVRMQAHGPATYVLAQNAGTFNRLWAQLAQQAAMERRLQRLTTEASLG